MKLPPKVSDFPFMNDNLHIYNLLLDYPFVYMGWDKFSFEMHSNLKEHGDKVDGVTKFDTKQILLEMNLDDGDARETILHEILHCILEGMGLDERNFDGETMRVTNEFLVVGLSKQIKAVAKLNPGLFKLILD